jgi:hypothetical protein
MSSIIDLLIKFPNILLYTANFLSCFDIKKISCLINKDITKKIKSIKLNCCCILIHSNDFSDIINQFANNLTKKHFLCFDTLLGSNYAKKFKENTNNIAYLMINNYFDDYYSKMFNTLILLIKNRFSSDVILLDDFLLNKSEKIIDCYEKTFSIFVINYAYYHKDFNIIIKYDNMHKKIFKRPGIKFDEVVKLIIVYLKFNYCNVGSIFIDGLFEYYYNNNFKFNEIVTLLDYISGYFVSVNPLNMIDINHINTWLFNYQFK